MRLRGVTLIEMLLALLLLGMASVAANAMIELAVRTTPDRLQRAATAQAAEQALFLIAEDLVCGDFAPTGSEAESPCRWNAVGDHELRIRTRERGAGAVVHRFLLAPGSDRLVRQTATADDSVVRVMRPLLDHVSGFSVSAEKESSVLLVSITLHDGTHVSRRLKTP